MNRVEYTYPEMISASFEIPTEDARKLLPGGVEPVEPWHGAGVAAELMDWAIANARERGAPELYLSVFDHNHRAKTFYARYGFADIGPCEFRVGNQIDEDRMWKRAL